MAASRAERLHVGGAAVVALVIALVGWFLLISPQRSDSADVQDQTANAELQNTVLQGRINQLTAEKKKAATYGAALAKARAALPSTSDMAAFLRHVQSIGSATSTKVTSISVDAAKAVESSAPVVGATTSPTASASPTASSATDSSTTAAASGTGLYSVPISASVTGTQRNLARFLTELQSGQPRAVLLTSVTRGQDAAGGSLTALQLEMQAFVAPETNAASTAPTTTAGGN
ncbi:type IV pilus assembly protein PilO [Jatrophihabitans endophyticus]|uniref:Type IV pilus assembly protein PilO n=1 Tax=Jatrophihabitans endophyticus TaxID=1206085 RepID=A0A1M5UF81_9ACTN|nr:hypothetical protein [Jatrophihabitans endophyticus]SHH61590.1 type IV pilus assembly protein PilO [Jatrophihabitans endophyticus]